MSTSNLNPLVDDHVPDGPLPPRCMQTDDPAEADRARRKLKGPQRRRFLSLPSLRKRKTSKTTEEDARTESEQSATTNNSLDDTVIVGDTSQLLDNSGGDVDVYRWAVLYENQRGFTVWGVAYYSSLSLLPNDPPPFTIPDANPHAKQPKCSLTEYPLPDGNWRWVSRDWMIDMRGEGAVQHDGFEYNWFFRKRGWRAEISALSSGGYVRRRRWVRLMVLPAANRRRTPIISASAPSTPRLGWSTGPSQPSSSIISSSSRSEVGTVAIGEVWQGDVEADWARCKALMKRVGRDGRRLELWRTWLSAYLPVEGQEQRRAKQWTEDTVMMPSEAAYAAIQKQTKLPLEADKGAIAAVVRVHGKDVIDSMIYPDTRAQFLDLLAKAGLLPDLTSGLDLASSGTAGIVDFWSYPSLPDISPSSSRTQ